MDFTAGLIHITRALAGNLDGLDFGPALVVYNPLDYARDNHEEYLCRYVRKGAKTLFLGMNPGPFGMLQTGVPFGAVGPVKSYLKIGNPVGRPKVLHPARPVQGLDCPREEVSGTRLWGMISEKFPDPDDFFRDFCVMNYCPLGFLDAGPTAKNVTPDKLPSALQKKLYALCDAYLAEVISMVGSTVLVGIGGFATKKLAAVAPKGARVGTVLHPSPASPAANRGWAAQASAQLRALGIWGA